MSEAVDEKATLPEKREFVINRPGHINWSDGRSNYPGSKLACFSTPEEVNSFFQEHGNLLAVHMWSGNNFVYVLYTNMLEGEELEEFNEYSRSVSEHMREWRAARAQRRATKEQHEEDAKKEMNRLLAVGKKCEHDHAAVIEDNAKLRAEVKKLRKGR